MATRARDENINNHWMKSGSPVQVLTTESERVRPGICDRGIVDPPRRGTSYRSLVVERDIRSVRSPPFTTVHKYIIKSVVAAFLFVTIDENRNLAIDGFRYDCTQVRVSTTCLDQVWGKYFKFGEVTKYVPSLYVSQYVRKCSMRHCV